MAVTRTRLIERRASSLVVATARLVVVRGPDKGRAVTLADAEVVIGTATSADLALTDDTVSRNHASLQLTDEGWLVRDLGSKNGVELDKRRVREAFVAPGDVLVLGDTRVRLESTRRRVEVPLSADARFGPLLGESAAARRLFHLLQAVAPDDATVLLSGETGTGKDLAAQAIHEHSRRAARPFVVLDCSAVAPSLFEAELFGHVRGAFTGAHADRPGALREADGGTLFLDEIGELPRDLQPKLLRAMERREVRPVGADQVAKVDVRFLAATSRDLRLAVNQRLFREDLYYRLNVITVRVPPLRARVEDIPLLATHFWQQLSRDPAAAVPRELMTSLLAYDWPGNVRELRNRIERALALQTLPEASSPALSGVEPYRAAKRKALDEFERAYVTRLLERAGGNVSEAARLADMDRVNLARLVRRHGLRR